MKSMSKGAMPKGNMNPKMERKSTMMGVTGSKASSPSGSGNKAKDVTKNKAQTGPSILKKPKG